MRKMQNLSAALFALACSFVVQAQEPRETRKITVVAKKYEFQPSQIELKVGEPVEITFTSEDTKHGFKCPELKLGALSHSFLELRERIRSSARISAGSGTGR